MKFVDPGPLADPDAAARKLTELANAFEPVQDDRIYIEKINEPFLYKLKGTPAEYKAGLERAIANGWLSRFLPSRLTTNLRAHVNRLCMSFWLTWSLPTYTNWLSAQ